MGNLGILTDDSVSFPVSTFSGRKRVHTFSAEATRRYSLPRAASSRTREFLLQLDNLCEQYTDILVLVSADIFGGLPSTTRRALEKRQGCAASVEILDTQTIGAGVGILVQKAAALAEAGASLAEATHQLRAAIPNIYTLLCVPQISLLAERGHLAPSQALAGSILGFIPLFLLEDNHLYPIRKARTWRRLLESVLEFIEEFDAPRSVSLLKSPDFNAPTKLSLRAALRKRAPTLPFYEYPPPALFADTFGERAVGVILSEEPLS
jgi:fatty acid-binding protein DegV